MDDNNSSESILELITVAATILPATDQAIEIKKKGEETIKNRF